MLKKIFEFQPRYVQAGAFVISGRSVVSFALNEGALYDLIFNNICSIFSLCHQKKTVNLEKPNKN